MNSNNDLMDPNWKPSEDDEFTKFMNTKKKEFMQSHVEMFNTVHVTEWAHEYVRSLSPRPPASTSSRDEAANAWYERFWDYVRKTDGCWEWTGAKIVGYGTFSIKQKPFKAHRISYELAFGPIKDGLVLDHLCRNPGCVNPDHLEATTQRINTLRGFGPSAKNAQKTHCSKGHEFKEGSFRIRENRYRRECIECRKVLDKANKQKSRDRKKAKNG